MITMTDVANLAGVSLSTVSHVINRTRKVSPETLAAVLDAIERTGYIDTRLQAAGTPPKAIGAVVPSVASPHFGELVEGMSAEAFRRGVDLLLMTTGEDSELEYRAVEALVARRVDGIILIPSKGWKTRTRPLLRHRQVPAVLVDRLDDGHFDQVGCENANATEALVSHLLSLGHTRIGFIRGLAGLSTTEEREEGFRGAFRRHRITLDEHYVVDGLSSVSGGRLAAERLLMMETPPTAVFCSNNNMTMGALAAFRQLNVRLRKDLALVAFDDLEWSDIVRPGITSMAQPFHAMGSRSLQMILDRLDQPASPPRTVRLPPSFEHRESCGCDHANTGDDSGFTLSDDLARFA